MEDKKISVLIYNSNEPLPRQGGMERITDTLARQLKARGIKVVLLCSVKNRLGEKYDAPTKIYYIPEIGKREFVLDVIKKEGITHLIDQTEGGIVGRYGIFKRRDSLLKDVELIVVQHNSAKAFIRNYKTAVGVKSGNLIKQFCYNRLILPIRKIHSIMLIRSLSKDLCRNYDKIVLLSHSFISDFQWFYKKADKSKLIAIPNMNSYSSVNVVDKEQRVLFVGRLISNTKGCDKLLRIWSRATKNIEGWHLDIVGDGQDRAELEKYAENLGLKNYTFYGFKDPRPFYERASVFCMTSIYEGFGLVLTEAMQHGVVPMAFDSFSSVRDIISDGDTGYLITPFEEVQYSEKLRELMTDKSLLNIYGKRAKDSVNKFSTDNVVNQWVKLLNLQ